MHRIRRFLKRNTELNTATNLGVQCFTKTSKRNLLLKVLEALTFLYHNELQSKDVNNIKADPVLETGIR